jgi:catabolite regulation protein CreA
MPFKQAAHISVFALVLGAAIAARAESIGEVDTAFHVIKDDKISVEAFDDPLVHGVTCYVSRARTGGMSGAIGLAEDKSEASIACRQVGPISFAAPLAVQAPARGTHGRRAARRSDLPDLLRPADRWQPEECRHSGRPGR